MMGSLPGKRFRNSSKSNNCYKVDVGRYAPMRGVCLYLSIILQLTTFSPWKHVDPTIYPPGRSYETGSTPPLAPPAMVNVAMYQTISYPR